MQPNPRGTPARGVRRPERAIIAKVRSSRREAVAKLKPEDIDYKRLDILTHFVTTTGKIEAARRTGASRKQQAQVVRAVKRARYLALLPYVIDDRH
jgi:small subunit ribosomal protein S18